MSANVASSVFKRVCVVESLSLLLLYFVVASFLTELAKYIQAYRGLYL